MSRDFRELGGRDAYALLGLDEDADAQEIKRAWRAMSRVHHADVGGSDNVQSLLNVAYDTLSDRALRDEYDHYRRTVLLVGAAGPGPVHEPPARPWQRPPPGRGPSPARERAARAEAARKQAVREQAAREQVARGEAARAEAAHKQAVREQAAREQAAREQAAREQAAREPVGRDQSAGAQRARGHAARAEAADEAERGQPARGHGAARRQSAAGQATGPQPARDHAVRDHAVRDHAVRDHAVRDHAVREQSARPEQHTEPRHVREPDEWDRWDYDEPEEHHRFESEPEQGRHEAAPPFGAWSAPRQADPRRDFISTARPVGYDNLAIVSLVLALVFAPAALVTAPMALYRIRRTGAQGRALAITALILVGVLTIALTSGYIIGTHSPSIAR